MILYQLHGLFAVCPIIVPHIQQFSVFHAAHAMLNIIATKESLILQWQNVYYHQNHMISEYQPLTWSLFIIIVIVIIKNHDEDQVNTSVTAGIGQIVHNPQNKNICKFFFFAFESLKKLSTNEKPRTFLMFHTIEPNVATKRCAQVSSQHC